MKELLTALKLFLALSILTGIVYPLIVTGLAQGLFPHQANGSTVLANGRTVGSSVIGQQFDDPKYFWGRPSATGPFPYNAALSSGSNLGPTNPALVGGNDAEGKPIAGIIQDRVTQLRAADPGNEGRVPSDLATTSGSGLDPNISIAAAEYQVARIARARGLTDDQVRAKVRGATSGRQFGLFGEPAVNVLLLNLALDGLSK